MKSKSKKGTSPTCVQPMSVRPSPARKEEEGCDLRDLHLINTLFAPLTGHDLYLAAQIRDAIRLSLEERETLLTADATFYAAAARLLKTTLGTHAPSRGFYHWDATETPAAATPLFTRDAILAALKTLAPYRDATLLITNLRPALLPQSPRRRPRPRHHHDYAEHIALIRSLSAAHAPTETRLQLLFL